jgi:hypothetical protein
MRWRGELAGYAGTLVLEEVDEDEHVARYRFQGIRDGATATATITVAGDVTAHVHAGHGSDLTAEQVAAAAREVLGVAPPARHPGGRRALVVAGAATAAVVWALRGRR